MITTNTPLAMFLRKGTLADPYVYVTETNRMITDGGTIVLQEFPINQTGYVQYSGGGSPISDAVAVSVVLTINSVDVTFSEVRDPSVTLGAEQFRVDYEFGLLEFDPTLYGTEVVKTITYAGRGAYYIAASRVYDDSTYTSDLSNDQFGTLQDVLDSVSSINVNSTTTSAPGTNAAVTVTGTSFDFTIPRGNPFEIAVEYPTIADMDANTNPIPSGYTPVSFDLAIITSNVEDPDNAKLYMYNGSSWDFISDMSGATGPTGPYRDYQWDGTSLQWRNDADTGWDPAQKLSPDIQWNGTQLSVVEPGSAASYVDLGITPSFSGSTLTLSPNDGSPDATYDIGIVVSQNGSQIIFTPNEIGAPVSYDIGFVPSFDANGRLTITPNDNNLTAITYDLGWSAAFTGTTLTLTPDNGDAAISADLGITPSWDANGTLTITPNEVGSPVSYDLGWDASFTDTTLTFTPDASGATPISSDLGVTPTWNASELTITPNYAGATGVSADLGLEYTWGGTGLTDTTLTIQNKVGGAAISQELGTSAEWGDGVGETITSVRFQNGDGTYTAYQELGLDAAWSGTELTITTPDGALPAVDLQADSPTITASATSVAYTGSAAVTVTEPTPNTFNLDFDIPVGEPLTINVTYASISDMNSNTSPTPSGYTPTIFDLALIQSVEGEENVDNAKMYFYNGSAWTFVSDLSGAKGETGDTGPTGPIPDHQWVGTSLQFELPEGGYGALVDLKGDSGLDSDIANTSTLGNLNGLANQKVINEYVENNKVNKAGDTMTGNLTIDNADFQVLDSVGNPILSVDASAAKAYVGANEVAALNSYVAGVKETNANNDIAFWSGTQAEYDAIPTPDANTIYFITES